MKKIFYVVACALMMVGCQGSSSSFTISGVFDNEDGAGKVNFIEGITSMDNVIETKTLDETGQFSFSGKVETPYMAQISKSGLTRGQSYRGIVFVESGDIKVEINEAGRMIASGTKLNDKFYALLAEFDTKGKEWKDLPIRKQMSNFESYVNEKLSENLDNPIGVFLLTQVIFDMRDPTSDEIRGHIARFTPEMQAGKDLAEVKAKLENLAVLDIGAPYMNFVLPNIKGIDVAFSSLVGEGKWVLIDFWATWCAPCMAEIPHLKEVYEEYHKLGFEICGVSLDRENDKWVEYCTANLPWINLLAKGSDVAKIYQVAEIPTNFLISPEGKIVAKNLRGSDISKTLEKFIKK